MCLVELPQCLTLQNNNATTTTTTISQSNGLQWYCEYLQYHDGTQSDCSIPHNESAIAVPQVDPRALFASEVKSGGANGGWQL